MPELTNHLKEILNIEQTRRAAGELPTHAPAPIMRRKTFKELGSPTEQAKELTDQRIELSADELRAAAERARARLEAAGQIDSVWEQQGVGTDAAPSFDTLEGKTIELRWRYYIIEDGKRKPVYIWCSGEVVEVADGKTTKKSNKCKSPLPWGAVRIRWPEDKERDEPETFVWSVLKPVDYNRDVHLGWRLDAAQLAKERAE